LGGRSIKQENGREGKRKKGDLPAQIAEQDGKPHPPVTEDFEQRASENVHALRNKPH